MATQDIQITARATAPQVSSTLSGQASGGCGCCSSEPTGAGAGAGSAAATTVEYRVSGMTCGHCVGAVTEQISALDGVRGVDVVLVAGGASRVTVISERPLADDAVADAVDEAGYRLLTTDQA